MTTTPLPAPPISWRTRFKEHALRLWKRLARRRRGLSWSAIIVGGLAATVALWPLAAAVWDLLGLTSVQAWRATAGAGGAVLLVAGVVGVNWKPPSERTSPVRLFWLILAAWAVAAGAVAAMTALAWLVLDTPQWQPPQELTPRNLDAIATRAFAIVAGLGGVALLVISYRRQRTTEADAERAERASEREVTKLFTERFTTASEQLGSEPAAVRLAGVHALAHLADDAPEGREDLVQMVIDVLCAYLRMPYTPEPKALPKNASKARREEHHERQLEFASFREVRHTIIRIIGDRLRKDTRWRSKNYDFTGVVFDGGDLSGAHFTGGEVSFKKAKFSGGAVHFIEAKFSGGVVVFNKAEFSGGVVSFHEAKFSGGEVFFAEAEFSGGAVSFAEAEFSGGALYFSKAKFSGGEVFFAEAEFSGGEVNFIETKFSGGEVHFIEAKFSGGAVFFAEAEFSGGAVFFAEAEFSGGKVRFLEAKFSGGAVSFAKAEFSGGKVFFAEAKFSGGVVVFNKGKFTSGAVNFFRTKFSGGAVSFAEAEFSGGEVFFAEAKFSGGVVVFNKGKFTSGAVNFFRTKFVGGVVVFHEAKFTSETVFFVEAEFTSGTVDFGWGGFASDLAQFRRDRGACPEGLPLDQTHAGPRVLLAPQAWEDPSEHEDMDHSTEDPHPHNP